MNLARSPVKLPLHGATRFLSRLPMKLQSLIRNSKKLSNSYKLQTDFLSIFTSYSLSMLSMNSSVWLIFDVLSIVVSQTDCKDTHFFFPSKYFQTFFSKNLDFIVLPLSSHKPLLPGLKRNTLKHSDMLKFKFHSCALKFQQHRITQ